MASINLGRVGFVLRGTYNSSTAYKQLDVVYYNGSSYVAKINCTGIAPGNASAWQELTGISSAVESGIAGSAVQYDTVQTLTGQQKETARNNIGAASAYEVGLIQTNVNNLSARVIQAEDSVGQMQTDVANLTREVNDLSPRVTQAENDIDDIRADMAYIPMDLTAFSISPSEAEIGSTVRSVSYTYSANKIPTTLKIDGSSITPYESGSGTLSVSLTSDKTWTMTATDSGSPSNPPKTSSKNATLHFYPYIYWGVSSTESDPTSALVTGLANKRLSGTKAMTFTVTAGEGQYIYFCCPTRSPYGAASFKVNGFDGGFEPAQTVSVTTTNADTSTYTENYYVYRSTNPTLGQTTVVVS